LNTSIRELHAGRYILRRFFDEFVQSQISEHSFLKVAVVGGSVDEPELQHLRSHGREFEVTVFGIESEGIFLDLNRPFADLNFISKFDLVICSQVLEHIWNLSEALKTITGLAKEGGFLWINCPTSNHAHGSPEYFSAGYTSKMLRTHLVQTGVEILYDGEVGTERLYKMTHSQLFWPSYLEHQHPFLRGIHRSRSLFPLRFVRNFLRNLQAAGWSKKVQRYSIFSTETYVGCRKTISRA